MTGKRTVAFAIASVLAFGGTFGVVSVPALAEDSSSLQQQLDDANTQLTNMGYHDRRREPSFHCVGFRKRR